MNVFTLELSGDVHTFDLAPFNATVNSAGISYLLDEAMQTSTRLTLVLDQVQRSHDRLRVLLKAQALAAPVDSRPSNKTQLTEWMRLQEPYITSLHNRKTLERLLDFMMMNVLPRLRKLEERADIVQHSSSHPAPLNHITNPNIPGGIGS